MPVTRVVYAQLVNLGNYENVRLEVEVTPEPGQAVAEAFDQARGFVRQQVQQMESDRDRYFRPDLYPDESPA